MGGGLLQCRAVGVAGAVKAASMVGTASDTPWGAVGSECLVLVPGPAARGVGTHAGSRVILRGPICVLRDEGTVPTILALAICQGA